MSPGYKKPVKPVDFEPITLDKVASEDSEFYLKVINQHETNILVYLDAPPARYMEPVSGGSPEKLVSWEGWNGKTKTMRG